MTILEVQKLIRSRFSMAEAVNGIYRDYDIV